MCEEDLEEGAVQRQYLGTYTDGRGDTIYAWFEWSELSQSPASVGSPAKVGGYAVKCARAKISLLFESDLFNANLWRYSMRQGPVLERTEDHFALPLQALE